MLEKILIEYFDLQENWYDIEENREELWNKSYNKLIDLLYDLDNLGVLNSSLIVDELDNIHNEN